MDTQRLIFLQMELECIRLNKNGYLEAFQCDNPDEVGRLAIYRDAERYYRFLSQDVDATIRQHLKLLREEMLFTEHEKIQRILSEESPSTSMFYGRTSIFPEEALSEAYEDTAISFGESSLCAIKIDGQVVASCSSVRENGKAAEAWVHTEEAFRGKAYGQRVVLAWARRITEKGKVAFYSHSIHNISSQRLVEKLPFIWVFDLVSYS